jgi:anti-sigma factor RsiW
MAEPNLTDSQPHDEAEALLPWYATGQLDERDRIRVETHLSACAECRDQLAMERRLVQEFRTITPEMESGWARLRARIQRPAVVHPKQPGVLGQFWMMLSRPAVAGVALAQLAFVVVAGSILVSLSRPTYHTLGSAPAPASANVIVMFRPEATVQDVDDTLKSAGASIVDGPTDANAYLLHVSPQQRHAALSRLQAEADVQLAQPIDGVAQ